MLAWLQGRSYELLCALIPVLEKRVPEYEFRGYGSREAMDTGDYDPEQDRSPTMPEIRGALTEASRVNGFDVFVHLKALVDPKLARRWVTAQLAETDLPELAELALREWGPRARRVLGRHPQPRPRTWADHPPSQGTRRGVRTPLPPAATRCRSSDRARAARPEGPRQAPAPKSTGSQRGQRRGEVVVS